MLPRRATLALTSALLATLALSSGASCVLLTEIDYDLIQDATKDAGVDAPAPECTEDAQCDDQASCTIDQCVVGQCSHAKAPAGTSCGPSTCASTSSCDDAGTCVATPVQIDDGNVCTNDVCDMQTGAVTHESLGSGCVPWVALPDQGAPAARVNHTAVWTGEKMIIWGGEPQGSIMPLGDGSAYDPKTRSWAPIKSQGAPTPRFGHRAVWTGQKMLVWGGYDANGLAKGGGIYDPATDQWTAMSTAQEPSPRLLFSAVWTGQKMIVYGGLAGSAVLNTGGAFDPAQNTWTPTPTANGPGYRFSHSATWTGSKMVVFAGYDLFDWFNDGAVMNGANLQWINKTATTNAPPTRESHTAVWTGTEVMIWGGWNGGPYLDTGALFDPAQGALGTWTSMATQGAPSARSEHIAVWTGTEMLVWGGCGDDLCSTIHGDGARYTKGANGGSWNPVPAVSTLSGRKEATAVWTGTSVIVWGGRDAQGALGTGAEASL